MKYRLLGRSNIKVSVVSMGCWAIISDATWGPQSQADSMAAIRASLDVGVNFFDTAEGYGAGSSEELLGSVLAEYPRDHVVIATKLGRNSLSRADVFAHCEASLRRLKTDYIDLYQPHWPSHKTPVDETLSALEDLRSQGKIRVIGVSNFGPTYLRRLLSHGRVESNQLCYSLLWRPIERDLQPLCVENDISIICYSPLCQGLLTGKFSSPGDVSPSRARTRLFASTRAQSNHGEPGCEAETFDAIAEIRSICSSLDLPMNQVALAWLLAQPGVTSVIAGARNSAQALLNAGAADLALEPSLIARLSAITQKVKDCAGANADLWDHVSRMEPPKL